MSSKAAKRRRKKITLAGGQSIAQRPTGRDRTHTNQPQEDARMTALTARARQCSITLDDAKAPWHGCAAGRAMAITVGAEAKDDKDLSPDKEMLTLWGAICHVRAVYAAYWRHNGIPSPYATCLRILAPADHMEATADSPAPDMRDDETKARQSTAAMMRIEGVLQSVGATSAKRIILGDQEASPKDALLMVAGLRAIVEGM